MEVKPIIFDISSSALKSFEKNFGTSFNNHVEEEVIELSIADDDPFKKYAMMTVDDWYKEKLLNYSRSFLDMLVDNFADVYTMERYLSAIEKMGVDYTLIDSIDKNVFSLDGGSRKITVDENLLIVSKLEQNGDTFLFDGDGNLIGSSLNSIYNLNYGYGGNQSSFSNFGYFFANQVVGDILRDSFPGASYEDYCLYLSKLADVGCGYVGLVNCLMDSFASMPNGEKKFYDTFGYNMYNIDINKGLVNLNYGPLVVDFYTWCYKEQFGYSSIEEITDVSSGCSTQKIDIFGYYLSDKYNMDMSSDYTKTKFVGGLLQKNLNNVRDLISNDISNLKKVMVVCDDYKLYSIDNSDGVKRKDVAYDLNDASHGMCVVDISSDGDLIVSSWGDKYLLDPNDIEFFYSLDINI